MTTTTRALVCALLSAIAETTCGRSDIASPPASRLSSLAAREAGRRLYQTHCAFCHGERGDGQGVRRSSFARAPRDFTDVAWRRSTSPEHVSRAIRDGVTGTAMPAWAALGDDAIANLTAYVCSFGRSR
ncbi:MAG TPA: cytochrome c [Vicinamibacterales bacterium]|jgi:mono/diheme cytochrome c family protein